MQQLLFSKTLENAVTPTRLFNNPNGVVIYPPFKKFEDCHVNPGNGEIRTGLEFYVPNGWVLMVQPVAKINDAHLSNCILIHNGAGEELVIPTFNATNDDITIFCGEAIAQAVLFKQDKVFLRKVS